MATAGVSCPVPRHCSKHSPSDSGSTQKRWGIKPFPQPLPRRGPPSYVLRVAYRCAHARVGTLPDVARGRGGRGSQQRMGDCVRAHLPRILEMELGEIMASPGQPPKRKSLLRQAQSEPPTGRFAWFRSLSTELQGELLELKEAHQRGAMQHTVRGLWEIASRNGVKVSLEAFTHWMK